MKHLFAPLLVFFAASAGFAATPGAAATPYAIQTDTVDGGGVLSTAGPYSNVGSVGNIEGAGAATSYAVGHGYIAQITGFTQPAITSLPNLLINENSSTSALQFTVSDAETVAASLTVTTASSNAAVVPNSPANLTLTGGSGSRTLTVTPAPDQFGSSTITLTVTDQEGGKSSVSFALDVNDVPLLLNKGQGVFANSFTDLLDINLKATDGDNTSTQLVYTIVAVPQLGNLRYFAVGGGPPAAGGTILNAQSTFTQDDIDNGRIRYTNLSPGSSDSFTFKLSDGRGGLIPDTVFVFNLDAAGAGLTNTIASSTSAPASPTEQTVVLSASVTNATMTVNEGNVTFVVKDSAGADVGTATTSPRVNNGATSVNYLLPANLPVGTYSIIADYSGFEKFKPSSDSSKKLGIILPGGTQPPGILPLTIDRNPAVVGTPVTLTASAQSNSGLPLNYEWKLFNHGSPAPIATLQSGPSNTLLQTFTDDGDFDISVVVSDGFNAAAQSIPLRVFPLGPNAGAVPNIFNRIGAASGYTNGVDPVGISVATSKGGALNIDGVPVGTSVGAGDTFAFAIPEQGARVDALRRLTGAKFTSAGIRVIELNSLLAGIPYKSRLMVPISAPEAGIFSSIVDDRTETGLVAFKISGKITFPSPASASSRAAKPRPSKIPLTATIQLVAGLTLDDIIGQDMDVGLSNVHTTLKLDKRGKGTPADTVHFSNVKVRLPKFDKKNGGKTAAGAPMAISFTLNGTDLASIGFDSDGVRAGAPKNRTAVTRDLQFAAVVAGMSYQSKPTIQLVANDQFGTIKGRR